MRQNLVDSCVIGAAGVPAICTGIFLRGSTHGTSVRLGRLAGHTVRMWKARMGGTRRLEEDEAGVRMPILHGGEEVEVAEHVFYVKKDASFMDKIMGKPYLVIVLDYRHKGGEWLCAHSPLTGDITLYGSALAKIGKMHFLDTQYADPTILNIMDLEALRAEHFLFLDNVNKVAEEALNANPKQKMEERNKQFIDTSKLGLGGQQQPLE